MDDVVIRLADVEDAAAVADVNTRSWQQGYAGLLPDDFLRTWRVEPERWRQRLENPGRVITQVAVQKADVVGFCSVGPVLPPTTEGDHVGDLYALYVLAEHWGQGVGYRLHQAGMRALGEAGFSEAVLHVLAANERTIAFYRRQGWQDTDPLITDDSFGIPMRLLMMRMPSLASPSEVAGSSPATPTSS